MNRQQAIRAWDIQRVLIILVAVFAVTAACERSDRGPDDSVTSGQNNSSTEVKQVMSRDGQNNNQEGMNQSNQTASNVGEKDAKKPIIRITEIPRRGAGGSDETDMIGGTVSGVDMKQCVKCRIVIFAHADTWYVQPTVASPYTSINDDGTWESVTHLGWEYEAILVQDYSSYKPPQKTDKPPDTGSSVLAFARVSARK